MYILSFFVYTKKIKSRTLIEKVRKANLMNDNSNSILQLDENTFDISMPAKLIWEVKEECSPPIHWHKNIEINFLLEGHWKVNIDGHKQEIHGRKVMIINSKSVHWVKWQDFEKRNNLVIVFYYDFLKRYLPDLDDYYFVLPDDFSENDPLYIHLLKLCDICKTLYYNGEKEAQKKIKEDLIGIKVKGILCSIAYELIKECGVRKKKRERKHGVKYQERIKRACDFLEKNYKSEVRLEDLAKELNITKEHCARQFKEITGVTVFEYLSDVRLTHAYHLLTHTKKNITDIAMEVGFPDYRAFRTCFMRTYQMTPSGYREKMESEENNVLPG